MVHAPEPADQTAITPADSAQILRISAAGLLGWMVPGLGHLFIGDRVRGTICLAAIVLTFWTGVAIGGVRGTINPQSLWTVAQLFAGVNTGVAYVIRQNSMPQTREEIGAMAPPSWISADIGLHYTGVAGLLNILVIFDAMARSERAGRRAPAGLRGPPPESKP